MKSLRTFLAGVCVAALSPASFADLGPIVITPTRTAQAENISSATVYVITGGEIEDSGARTTSELLRGIPGVQVDDLFGNGTETSISVRGFSATANANTLVLVNGRRINHSDTASPDIHHIFPRDIERIEVLVGSAGSLYGDQAVGGVINIITRKSGKDLHRVSTTLGSYDYRGVAFSSTRQLSDSLGYRLSAETFSADHYRDHNAEENSNFQGVVEYRQQHDSFFIEVQQIKDELELPGALLENEFDQDPTQFNAGFIDDFISEDTSVYRFVYERDLAEHKFYLDAAHYKTDADVEQSFRNTPSGAAGFTKRENNSINPKLSGSLAGGVATDYVLGIDLEETDFDLNIPNAFGVATSNSRQDTESLYFQLIPRLTEKLHLTFGMRRSDIEKDLDYADALSTPTRARVEDDVTVKELGLAYYLDDQTRLSVRYDENFRFAKIDEQSRTLADTILDTQTGESVELGIQLTRGVHQLTASVYRLTLEDEIVFDPTLGPDFGFGPIGLNVNLDETRRDGLTLSLLSQLSQVFALKTDIGLVDAKYESGFFAGNEISGVADRIARLRGDYRFNDSVTGYLEYHYSSAKYAQGDNANEFGKLGSITVINAGIGYQYRAWDVNFRINNLADEKHAEFVTNNGFGAAYQPSPDRIFTLTAGYSFE